MENSSKKGDGVLETILTIAGIITGVFLITKLVRQETHEVPMSKESDPDSGLKGSKLETKSYGGNDRLQRILSVVRERGIITPKELRILFPEVSTRTLRRDMDVLAKAKLVSQKGSTKSTFYKYTGK
jgi:predicted HTH transcriptional regulator